MNKHLIVYAKKPEAGKSKTRLGTRIGYDQAAGVYARLLFSYLTDLLRSDFIESAAITLSAVDKDSAAFFKAAYPEFRIVEQITGGLGERMQASFDEVFALGAEAAVLTGSDIPILNAGLAAVAFHKLEENQIVLGPAEDGGYYLIGMRKPGWNVFDDISWSNDTVLEETLKQVNELGLKKAFLPKGFDLDIEADYLRWIKLIKNDKAGG